MSGVTAYRGNWKLRGACGGRRLKGRLALLGWLALMSLPLACALPAELALNVEADAIRISSDVANDPEHARTVVHANATGGNDPYRFFWTVKDPMGQPANELLDDREASDPVFTAGTLIGPYLLTCVVTDAVVRVTSDSTIIYVSQDLGLTLSADRQEVPNGGGANGQSTVEAEAWGGTAPYTYDWKVIAPTGETANDRLTGTALAARVFTSSRELGTYRIQCTVTDATRAITTQTIDVLVDDVLSLTVSADRPLVTPGGGPMGQALLSALVSGGKPPYTYSWQTFSPDGSEGTWLDDASQSHALFTSPSSPGGYRAVCTVADARGQQVVASMIIMVDQQLSVSVMTNRERVSADGGPTGQAMVSTVVTGGTAPYEYRWTVLDPDDGDAVALIDNAEGPFTTFTSAARAGTYRLLCAVTDAVGQTASDALEIAVGQQLVGQVTVTSVRPSQDSGADPNSDWVASGGGANGQATITAEAIGGSPPYTYTWTVIGPDGEPDPDRLSGPSSDTRIFRSTNAIGSYLVTCTITDSTGVSFSDSAKITVYSHVDLQLISDRVQMPTGGGVIGSAHLNSVVSGGTPPFTYAWAITAPDGAPDNTRLNDLTRPDPTFTSGGISGIYQASCIATDSVGQTAEDAILLMVGQPVTLDVTLNRTDVIAAGGQAHLTADARGGIPPYEFEWVVTNPFGAIENERFDAIDIPTPTFTSSLTTGTYTFTCTVTDAAGFVAVLSTSLVVGGGLDQGLSVDVTSDHEALSGAGEQAALAAAVLGGVTPITYEWLVLGPAGDVTGTTLDDPLIADPTFTAPAQVGTYRISCTITDSVLKRFTDSLHIYVGMPLTLDARTEKLGIPASGGQAILTTLANGGVSPYTYSWTALDPAGASAAASLSSLTGAAPTFTAPSTAGTYRFTCVATDAAGTTAGTSLEIYVGMRLSSHVTVTKQSLPSGQSCSLNAAAQGGIAPYTYTWTALNPSGADAAASLSATNLANPTFTAPGTAGTYRLTCTITDAANETFAQSIHILVGMPLTADVRTDRLAIPAAGGQATLTAIANGGVSPYTYAWTALNPSGASAAAALNSTTVATPTFTAPAIPGTYRFTCTITDSAGTTAGASLEIYVGMGLSLDVTSVKQSLPSGQTTVVTASGHGGISPYTYAWTALNPAGTDASANLSATNIAAPTFTAPATTGTYRLTCTVTDAANETFVRSIHVLVGMPLSVDVLANKAGIPAGGGQSIVTAIGNGGVAPYTYAWTALDPAGGSAAATLSSTTAAAPTFTAPATAGTYRFICTITDAAGTTFTDSEEIYVGMGLSVDVTSAKQSLPSAQTTLVTGTPRGGISPYTYAWTALDPSGADAAASLSATNIAGPTFTAPAAAGTYRLTCTVTDAADETFADSVHIVVGMPLTTDVRSDKLSIPATGGQAALTAVANGGVSTYTYAWTALNPSGASAAAALSNTSAANPTFTAPATPGTYRFTCTITDSAGTTAAASLEISVGMGLSLSLTTTKSALPSTQTAQLVAAAQGGIPSYTYAWTALDPSGGDAAATLSATNIANPVFTAPATAGTYRLTCTATDAVNETFVATLQIVVGMPLSLDVTAGRSAIPAGGGTTTLTATVNGGISTYTYAWTATNPSGGDASASLSGTTVSNPTFTAPATAGTYHFACVVTDSAGTTFRDSESVYVGMSLSANVTSVKQSLPSTQTTVVTATARGGISAYTYAWTALNPSGGSAAANLSATNVAAPTFTAPATAGTYRLTCTVTDSVSATFADSIHILVGMPLTADVRTDKMAIPATGGQAALTAVANGGVSTYTYAWTALNPSGASAAAALSATNVAGPTFTAPATPGTYRLTCTITDSAGTTAAASLQLYVGMSLSADITAVKQSLPSAQTTTVAAAGHGGISPYTYAWTALDPSGADASASLSATNIAGPTFTAPATAGTYRLTCTVTDTAGATFARSIHILVGMPLTLDVTARDMGIPATGGQTTLSASVTGGVSAYTYAWTVADQSGADAASTLNDPAVAGPVFTAPATPGTYRATCQVTDAAGAKSSDSVAIQVGMPLSAYVRTTRMSLPSTQTATFSVTPGGGVTAYTYAWLVLNPSGADVAATVLDDPTAAAPVFTAPATAGTYRVTCTVTDARSATATGAMHVHVGMDLSANVTATQISIPAGQTSTLAANAGGGVTPYTYAWTAADSAGGDASAALSSTTNAAPTFTAPAGAGTYRITCTVTDADGRTFSDSVHLLVGMPLSLAVFSDKQTMTASSTATFTAVVNGGVAAYTYAWTVLNPGGADVSATVLSDPAVASTTFTAPVTGGTYRASCKVTDSLNTTFTTSMHVLVTTNSITLTTPAAEDADGAPNSVMGATALVNSTYALIYVGVDLPQARNLKVRLSDASDNLGNPTYLSIDGVSADGHYQTEYFNFGDPGTGKTVTGTKPFARVEMIRYVRTSTSGTPSGDETVQIGVGNIFGLPEILSSSSAVRQVIQLPNTTLATPADYTVITTAGRQGVNFVNAANDPDGATSYQIFYDDN